MIVRAVTGDAFEVETMGLSFAEVPHKYRRNWRKVPFEDGVRWVSRLQSRLGGWDAKNPKTKLIKAVFNHVAGRLGKAKHDLRVLNCVGTCLDCRGYDCIFVCNGVTVTVDLTISGSKPTNADVLLTRRHFLNNEHYRVADEIARRLLA